MRKELPDQLAVLELMLNDAAPPSAIAARSVVRVRRMCVFDQVRRERRSATHGMKGSHSANGTTD